MTIEVLPVAAPGAPISTTAGEPESFDERWAAWQAKGAAHDRAVRRKLAIAAPILIIVAAVIVYALLGR
jgi:small-conductance mechanosensitive channel